MEGHAGFGDDEVRGLTRKNTLQACCSYESSK